MNPEIILLIISVMNSGFIPTFRARSDHQETMKIRLLSVLTYITFTFSNFFIHAKFILVMSYILWVPKGKWYLDCICMYVPI